MELVSDLRELNDNVCLGFGSVLSVVRDHDLIPHDDDLDVLIGFEPDQAAKITDAIELIESFLREKGYTVSGRPTAHRLVTKPGQTKVDVFVGIFEGDSISWYPGRHGVLRREMIFPAREVPFLGTDCAVPANPEMYLQLVYGPSWSTPDPNFHHNPQPGAYAALR
jgi:phosphorylcholine metabolism protein LicD